ncbi:MAG: hypothetical protein AB7N76_08300 [Planctomycetota bacterium]
MRASVLAPLLSLLLAAPALAERYHLADGRVVEGEAIGEAEGTLEVLGVDGRTYELARADVARVESGAALPARWEARLERLRQKHLEKRWRAVDRVLARYGRAKPEERAAIAAELEAFAPAELVRPLGKALTATREPLRLLALERLPALRGVDAERPLVQTAVLAKEAELRRRAHEGACKLDATRVRTYYEQIAAMPTAPARRARAMDYLGVMGDIDAAPGLILVLEKVEMELKATLATAGGLRRVPVNLGTQGGAAINAPIELPETTMIGVQTKVSVTTLRELKARARGVLKSLSGEDRGDDPKAWRAWWEQRPRAGR